MDSFKVLIVILRACVVISLDSPTLTLPSFIQEGEELSFKCSYKMQKSKIHEVDIKVWKGIFNPKKVGTSQFMLVNFLGFIKKNTAQSKNFKEREAITKQEY